MRNRHLYRPLTRPETNPVLASIEWGYAETPPHMAGRPGILPSRHAFGVVWTERMLTREECQKARVLPHKADAYA